MSPIRRILVPTDFSEPAAAAWRYAQMLAGQFGSQVHLVHVVSVPYVYDAWGTETVALQMADLLTQSEDASRRQLRKFVPKAGPLATRVVTATLTGMTVQELLDYIAKKKIDLVVMGTHGRGVVGHLLMGSVAERIVQHSPVPVLTVHGKKAAAPRKKRQRRAAPRNRKNYEVSGTGLPS